MIWKWYSARTLYRSRALGAPQAVDDSYDPHATLSEVRVVLLRARNFDEAIVKAEAEARRYEAYEHPPNRYGQRVIQTYLGACDVFELFDVPAPHAEVYSRTEVVPDRLSDEQLIEARMGPEEIETDKRRSKFVAGVLSGRSRSDA